MLQEEHAEKNAIGGAARGLARVSLQTELGGAGLLPNHTQGLQAWVCAFCL